MVGCRPMRTLPNVHAFNNTNTTNIMTKKLLITQCPDSMRWYRNKIGELVDYLGDVGYGEYKSREPAGYINFVQHADAKVVEIGIDMASEGSNDK